MEYITLNNGIKCISVCCTARCVAKTDYIGEWGVHHNDKKILKLQESWRRMSKERSTRTGDMPEMVLQVWFEVHASLSLRYSARL